MKRICILTSVVFVLVLCTFGLFVSHPMEAQAAQAETPAERCLRLGNTVASLQNDYLGVMDYIAREDISKTFLEYFSSGNDVSCVPWYSVGGYTWKFVLPEYAYPGDDVGVIWVCMQDGTDIIVAYTTAIYIDNGRDGEFDNVRSYVICGTRGVSSSSVYFD